MRRQLVDDLPLLMTIYPGLKPWDLDLFTFREVQGLIDHATAALAALKEDD